MQDMRMKKMITRENVLITYLKDSPYLYHKKGMAITEENMDVDIQAWLSLITVKQVWSCCAVV